MNTINDNRRQNLFSRTTFSNYKKSGVMKELLNSLIKNDIEGTCFWSAECVCSGYYVDLWNLIINYSCEYINLANPRLILLINRDLQKFKQIINEEENIMNLRNNVFVRKLFGEIFVIICTSNRKTKYQNISIKDSEVDLNYVSSKLVAPNTEYVSKYFKLNDPKELYMCLNEFLYQLIECENFNMVCYWYEWMVHFNNMCIKKKSKIKCVVRDFIPENLEKYNTDGLWIIWEIFFKLSEKKGKGVSSLMKNLFDIFILKYSTKSWVQRRYVIYYAISLCIDKIDFSIQINKDMNNVKKIVNNINVMYGEIKKNEVIIKEKTKEEIALEAYMQL